MGICLGTGMVRTALGPTPVPAPYIRCRPPLRRKLKGCRADDRRQVDPSFDDDVVGIQRLVQGCEPLGAGGGTTAAFFVDRQLQRVDEGAHLLAGSVVRRGWPCAERRLVEVVKRGEPAGKEFSI